MKPFFNTSNLKQFVKELGELQVKLLESGDRFAAMDEIDVGTAPKELVYEEDKLKLYHYKQETQVTCSVPVLIVYALINRQYMLDLQPDRSMIRNLLRNGIDVYIIDWGYPTMSDMYLTMDDYINGYVNNCVEIIRKKTGKEKITPMGVCQGGTFTAIYSALYPEKVQNLVTMVAPIDFSTDDGLLFSWSKNMNVDALVDTYRIIPGDFLNSGFLMLLPFNLHIKKYMDMLGIAEDKEKLLNFLRMEKWIFDSPGLAGECLRQFLKDLYQENKLVKGTLKIGDRIVDLKKITMPLLNIYAASDHLVPPASSKPLNNLVGTSDKTLYEFKGGHIGVFVGSRSQEELAPAISKWLHERDGEKRPKTTKSEMIPSMTKKELKTKATATRNTPGRNKPARSR